MHILSAANIKSGEGPTNLKPREGTKIRLLYDRFYACKGESIVLQEGDRSRITQLTDIYGLDIRCIRGRCGLYVLVGEWFGETYIDYIADKKI